MGEKSSRDIILSGFDEADLRLLIEGIGALGRVASSGDPVNDDDSSVVLVAAYDESSLRCQRAAALEDARPWCFCVSASDRGLVAAASLAREGRFLLLPPEDRELRRVLSALADDGKARSSGSVAFSGLRNLEAEFAWKTSAFDVSPVCRSIARLLVESGFYASRTGEDECALALEEAFVNSMEHGNLGLDSSLKPDDPLIEDPYDAEREKRLADPAYGERLILMRVAIGPAQADIVIEDEGAGFDTSKIDMSPSGLDVSGKGFWLIKQPFDDASYNTKGNKLTLTKRRPK
jgi:anti-sigma regulatory factor (Ser/Thr protein kinase)